MNGAEQNDLEFAQRYTLKAPKRENSIPIREVDWAHLKKKLGTLKQGTRWWAAIANALFGVLASAIVALFGTPECAKTELSHFTTYMVLTIIFCVIVGILCLFIDHLVAAKVPETLGKDLLEHMERIEAPFKDAGTE